MHRSCRWLWLSVAVLGFAALIGAQGKPKKQKAAAKDPQDQIEVYAQIPVPDGSVRRFITTRHFSSYYLYAELSDGKTVMLIDLTKAKKPAVLASVAYPADSGSMFAVAGTSALVTEEAVVPAPPAAPRTLRLMDFSDPAHPIVTKEFTGITAMSRDEQGGLIFLGDAHNIWILHQTLALDPEVEKEYARKIVYQ